MESEQGRLERLYAEMGDEHLLDMAAEPDDLTDEARGALDRELARRGLAAKRHTPVASPGAAGRPLAVTEQGEREQGFGPGIPGIYPGAAPIVEQALERPRARKDGLASLISFYDGISLSKACEILEAAEMEPVIEPIDGDAQSSVPPRYEVWLEAGDIDRAQALLREKMGLFPLQEVEEGGVEVDGPVAVFTSATDAENARATLIDRGLEPRVRRSVDEDSGLAAWEVSVDPHEHDRALEVLAAELGIS